MTATASAMTLAHDRAARGSGVEIPGSAGGAVGGGSERRFDHRDPGADVRFDRPVGRDAVRREAAVRALGDRAEVPRRAENRRSIPRGDDREPRTRTRTTWTRTRTTSTRTPIETRRVAARVARAPTRRPSPPPRRRGNPRIPNAESIPSFSEFSGARRPNRRPTRRVPRRRARTVPRRRRVSRRYPRSVGSVPS